MLNWLKSILEDKDHPGKLSSARFVGLVWGLTAAAVALILVLDLRQTDHMLVAELIGGTLVALGLRKAWNGRSKED